MRQRYLFGTRQEVFNRVAQGYTFGQGSPTDVRPGPFNYRPDPFDTRQTRRPDANDPLSLMRFYRG